MAIMQSAPRRIRSGSRVTKLRLYPKLYKLLREKRSGDAVQHSAIPNELIEALRKHVSNNMPLRLILLEHDKIVPNIRLVGRSEIIDHIMSKMTFIDKGLLAEMVQQIDSLGRVPPAEVVADARNLGSREEDARENPRTAVLEFLFQEFARYAILSHTWLPTGEIIYQDTLQKDWLSRTGPGIDKLKGFCEVTHRDHGITLAWIDTLCINKESSTELDESIQSMYKWYRNSSICITYLRDTTSLEDMELDSWFKRGWTLQELIAPENMQFYGYNWTRLTSVNINDKAQSNIQQIVFNVTGIKAEELLSFDPLTGSDVQTRMRWVASRTTTREEDRAYSLMGIFGVNFSISYGEGGQHAFFRLIEAIISRRHTSHIVQVLHWAGRAVPERIHISRLIPSGPECYLQEAASRELAIFRNEPTVLAAHPKQRFISKLYNYFQKMSRGKINTTKTKSTLYPTIPEPMALTQLGLRVKMLLVDIPLNHIEIHDPSKDPLNPDQGPCHILLTIPPTDILESSSFYLEKLFPEIPRNSAELLQYCHPQKPVREDVNYKIILGIYTFDEDDREDCVYLPPSPCAFLLCIPVPDLESMIGVQDISSKQFEPTSKIDTREVIRLKFRVSIKSGSGCYIIKRKLLPELGLKVLNVYL